MAIIEEIIQRTRAAVQTGGESGEFLGQRYPPEVSPTGGSLAPCIWPRERFVALWCVINIMRTKQTKTFASDSIDRFGITAALRNLSYSVFLRRSDDFQDVIQMAPRGPSTRLVRG
jgi:hypothetical protein